jgi:hypothetical protein
MVTVLMVHDRVYAVVAWCLGCIVLRRPFFTFNHAVEAWEAQRLQAQIINQPKRSTCVYVATTAK